ncbi:maleylpyruvate isomerase N-terminal domain-containing protein [Dietzia sp. 179-F 9C3 NHS]|uniref:maleylpyruvate isomerase N-terminal domain-containing protein n=1 Tax=Dietzia sp. 179-F 9C3 NHS TaxID=3374295 RepID=UPI00387996DD
MTYRTWFALAAEGFTKVTEGLRSTDLTRPGLGDWDLRALLGHTTRAFLTIESYLRSPAGTSAPDLAGPAGYFRAAAAGGLADPTEVIARGRDAGAALGENPIGAALEIALRVTAVIDASPDSALVATPVGTMTLADYLPTRAFELTVHGIDLATASQQPIPHALTEAAAYCVALLADIASPSDRILAVLALTGRAGLPAGFSLL